LIQGLHPYVPGEQPKIAHLIKLNTNENPYPPSPKVLSAVKRATDGRLRLYPNPTAQTLREALARLHRCAPENIIVGNGSDEILAMAVRAFVEPLSKPTSRGRVPSESVVQFFTPSYSLYPVLAEIHGAQKRAVSLETDFGLPSNRNLRTGGDWVFDAALTFITTPNAPTGRGYSNSELSSICRAQDGVVLLDEAYVNFAREDAMSLALRDSNVLVARTFSKAFSLCFQRIGYCVGHPALIEALQKIRDSYNVNGLGQVAAMATLENSDYYQRNIRKIIAGRNTLSHGLEQLGFSVLPSETNFILARPPRFSAKAWLEKLRGEKILVRWFDQHGIRDFLRITVGTDGEVQKLLTAAHRILG